MRILSRVIVSFFLVLTFAGTALPWGNAPTHFSIGYDVGNVIPGYRDTFVCANACPDIAWTQVFKARGLEYVHTDDFAECVYQVAQTYSPWHPEWPATALAWGVHLAADEVIHTHITDEQPTHQLIELAMDTVIFYEGSPLGTSLDWEQYNVSTDCCSPWLIYLASRCYRKNIDHNVGLVYPWLAWTALNSLKATISIEYGYINAKNGTSLSEWFLDEMEDQGYLSGNWEVHYSHSVEAAIDWIDWISTP